MEWPIFTLAPPSIAISKCLNSVTEGQREDNITDWALEQFREHYRGKTSCDRAMTKDAIFHYVYAVVYDPLRREKYARNLKRKFPRIPFYADFSQWADWGATLMGLPAREPFGARLASRPV
jgi:predicted helicase